MDRGTLPICTQDRQYWYNVTLSHICATTVALEKQQVLHILSVVSSMQCTCAILSSAACPVLNIFPNYFIKGTIFKKVIEHKMCVLILPTTLV
jgi:hypothetical protein